MIKDNLYQPFELVLKEYMDVCPRGKHAHTFFEIIYIVSGSGIQYINDSELTYSSGDLFLVGPNDSHLFKIETLSQFFFIRFNNIFVQTSKDKSELVHQLDQILQNAKNEHGNIVSNDEDKKTVIQLMGILISEHLKNDIYHDQLINSLVNSILLIVSRNISNFFSEIVDETSEVKTINILNYIQSNIYYPEKLRVEVMSIVFSMSEKYLGRYFKKHTNETLQHYIMNYKVKLIENRLLHSNYRISEIAYEFGFTDKSHLNRMFKKYKGISPSDLKKGLSRES